VSGRDKISAQPQGRIEEYIEFNSRLQRMSGFGVSPSLIFSEHVIYDALFVFLAEVDRLERNSKMLGHDHRIVAVVKPRHSLLMVTESSCQFFMNMPITS